ncbi:DUF2379 family protein [Corallococcus sp. BB11-1]|uniref:DUF2379 family protein n=1 Tax=Corallococcus sp. BB11-1 TaxID=2996783 RepID=UPI002D1E4A3F|nr:DUF2379 family protein [Corallococcus sp. BB11-1]
MRFATAQRASASPPWQGRGWMACLSCRAVASASGAGPTCVTAPPALARMGRGLHAKSAPWIPRRQESDRLHRAGRDDHDMGARAGEQVPTAEEGRLSMSEDTDWDDVRALFARVEAGEALALTTDVRELLLRTAPQVAIPGDRHRPPAPSG